MTKVPDLDEVAEILANELPHRDIAVDMVQAHADIPRSQARKLYKEAKKADEYTEEDISKYLEHGINYF